MTDSLKERIARVIEEADATFGYDINLVRLVDNEATYRLRMKGRPDQEFPSIEDAHETIAAIRAETRAEAILSLLSPALQAGGELSEDAFPCITQWREGVEAILQRHGELRARDTADYAEVFDAHGEKVALTTRPDLILLLNSLRVLLEQHASAFDGPPSAMAARLAALEEGLEGLRALSESVSGPDFTVGDLNGAVTLNSYERDFLVAAANLVRALLEGQGRG